MSEQNKAVVYRFNEALGEYFRTGNMSKLEEKATSSPIT